MKYVLFFLLLSSCIQANATVTNVGKTTIKSSNKEKIVIAHRGASGYLPEHSIAAKTMAHAMSVDYIEQDVVMTKDDQLVVLHDIYLDRVTDVAAKFPERKRADERYYVIDFSLAEIQTLAMTEGFSLKDGKTAANFPQRFPLWQSTFKVHTLADEIELIQGLNHSMGKDIGIYPEIKSPAFHLNQGKDITKAVLLELKRYGYVNKASRAIVQSFDPVTLKRIKYELFAELNMQLKLAQLIAMTSWQETPIYLDEPTQQTITQQLRTQKAKLIFYDYDWMLTPSAMTEIAKYADAIGPWKPMLVNVDANTNKASSNGLVEAAHEAGLFVHPYTFRADEGRIPEFAKDFDDLLRIYYFELGVDGVFTDFPDKAVNFLQKID
ncbi:glycerophosphodiester phosphodiesterase [Colwellia sp. E2M01]|uniref:glycerophosphodiester phosphodiesterase n=1 Tax=Colwellia sp. E2M01 TaxID=2841561 RepID=UPI001C083888|nr:glycerophosphodiester phosphodiesterase [Colwellia sp. E2M01]MBU2869448.1 glycerophosphodiester phosphodiesterase [Colwellia sp. E2M01]